MTTSQWITTIIEFLMVVAVILGFIYEPLLIEWEEKQGEKMLKAFKERKKYRR